MTMFPINKQYVVSLDSLDLSFISQYIERPAVEKRVLWSKPVNCRELVYCEVQIPSDIFQEEEAYVELSEIYWCHICNKDVPVQYCKQHNKSRQHWNYKHLTEKALENVSKQINIDIHYVPTSDQHDKFYCEACSKVVLEKNRRQHNKSKYHLKSIENHKLDSMFIESYTANKEGDQVSNDNKEYESESETDWNFETDSGSEIEDFFPKQVIPHKTTKNVDKDNIECQNTLSKLLDTNKETTNFQKYLKDMMVKYKLKYDLPQVENNNVIIVMPNGYKEKVPIDAFHSYKRINNAVFCQLCKIRVGDDKSQHSNTERHVKNIMQPMKHSTAREMIGNKAWNHCLVCNDIVVSGPEHNKVYHKKHCDEKKSKSNELPAKNTAATPKMTFCDVCNIHTDANKLSLHLNDKNHINKLKAGVNKPSSDAGNGKIKTQNAITNEKAHFDKLHSNTTKDSKDICVTKSAVNNSMSSKPNTTESSKSAVEGNTTTEKTLPSTSKIKFDIPLHATELSNTVKLNEYKKQLAEFNNISLECLVCDIKVPVCDRNIIEHIEGMRHNRALDILLNEHNIEKKAYNFYTCNFCDKSFDDFVEHIDDIVHKFVKTLHKFMS